MVGAALVIGESLVDVVRGADADIDYPGGSAANVAVALARLGRPTWLATSFADDPYGALLAEHLAANDVRLAGDPGAVDRTSSAVATLDPSGAASYAFDLDWRLNPVRLPGRRGPGRGARLLDRRGAPARVRGRRRRGRPGCGTSRR